MEVKRTAIAEVTDGDRFGTAMWTPNGYSIQWDNETCWRHGVRNPESEGIRFTFEEAAAQAS